MAENSRKPKQIPFEVRLNWLENNRGILYSDEVAGTLYTATPAAFGGDSNEWSPEHLLLGAVSSCFMTTYLYFAKRMGLEITRLECRTTGVVETAEGKLQFTSLHVIPSIYVALDAWKSKANSVLEKTKEFCLISNTVKIPVTYEAEIITDLHPRYQLKDN